MQLQSLPCFSDLGGCCIEFVFFPNCIYHSPSLLPVDIYRKFGVYSLGAGPLHVWLSPLQFHCIILVIGCMGCFPTRFCFYHLLFASFSLLLSACHLTLIILSFSLGESVSPFLFLDFNFTKFSPISETFYVCVFFGLFVSVFGFLLYICLYQIITF